jgi:hypothetical protein
MSKVIADNFQGPNNTPANFPFGFNIGTGGASNINNIGIPGQRGFGVGVCPGPLPTGMQGMSGFEDPASDNYGNYQYGDGSIMVWIPAFYIKWGTGSNGLAINELDIKPFHHFTSVAAANAAGYALDRAFYDGGRVQHGAFADKYHCSNNSGIASSIRNRPPLTSALRGNLTDAVFAALNGSPSNAYAGAIDAVKTRGADFFCSSRFIFAALARLSRAHAQASSNTTYCAWYDPIYNHPKGCNNNAYGDDRDAAVKYQPDGNGSANCPLTGSANLFARTTHNGQNCGVADLNGVVWDITPGLTSDGTNLYILKTSASMKDVTSGDSLATDLWGSAGIVELYDDLGTSYEAWAGSGATKTYGSVGQVFSDAMSGNAWNWAGAGGMLTTGQGGTNPFGSDGFWDYKPNKMCPRSGGGWYSSSGAGVWALHLTTDRAHSDGGGGFRAALYL